MKRIGEVMKKYIVAIGLLVLLACAPPAQEAESTVGITAPDGYAVACAVGYTRMSPHYCHNTSAGFTDSAYAAGGCQNKTVANLSIPATARMVVLNLIGNVYSINVPNALDFVTANFFSDSGCTNFILNGIQFEAKEFVALPSTQILAANAIITLPVSTNGFYYNYSTNGVSFFISRTLGYYD